MKNYIFTGIAALVVGVIIGFVYHVSSVGGSASSTGTYNNGVGVSSITLLPTTANGTSTSILNSGASDRAIIGTNVMCTGVGTSQVFGSGSGLLSAGWTLTAATTTGASAGLGANANYILNTTLATTTGLVYNASSTEGVLAFNSRLWPVNTYLTFNFNATNTASCGLNVTWFSL